MSKVTRIDWTIKTGESWWSGTDTHSRLSFIVTLSS
jgi:hypothetical protein